MKAKVSDRNPVFITKERFYELKHFVKQYNWFKEQVFYIEQNYPNVDLSRAASGNVSDPTYIAAVKALAYKRYIDQIDRAKLELLISLKQCPQIECPTLVMEIIFIGALNDVSYDTMQASRKDVLPISRNIYYSWMRVFFFKLDRVKLVDEWR